MTEERPLIETNQSTLLFVDDEKNILSSLKRIFRAEGYNIVLATSGAEGLAILRQEKVDLVISDMRMPEMNGAEFLENVARDWPKITRILLTGYSEISATVDAINKGQIYKYISKPWEDNDIKLTVRHALEAKQIELERDCLLEITNKQNEELKEFNTNLEGLVKVRTAELDQTMGMLDKSYETLKESYSATIKVFSNLVEMREGAFKGESRKVSEMAQQLAVLVGLNEDQVQQVSFAGMLRNIGKIGFNDYLINSPIEEMSQDDRTQYKKHPVIAEATLMALEPLMSAAKLIRNYCERYDGNGYPDKLKGNEIPPGARIIAVVSDYFSLQNGALISGKQSSQVAINFIKDNSGLRYDPKVVDAFIKFLDTSDPVKGTNPNVSRINASDLEEGMILASDIITKKGLILLAKGSKIGTSMIKQIRNLESILNETLEIDVTR